MYFYELLDVLFFIRCLKFPDTNFKILDYVSFSSAPTRSASNAKLSHKFSSSTLSHHSYFVRLVRIWNSLPPINISLSYYSIRAYLKTCFWNLFITSFDPSQTCSFHVVCPCYRCSHLPIHTRFNLAVGVGSTCRHSISALLIPF